MAKTTNKQFLYVGHYITARGEYILKIGTTDNPERRAKEHTRNYKRAAQYTMHPDGEFVYDYIMPLSWLNTLRYEERNRERWKEQNIGEFVRNDRFLCATKPKQVEITIKKTYTITL